MTEAELAASELTEQHPERSGASFDFAPPETRGSAQDAPPRSRRGGLRNTPAKSNARRIRPAVQAAIRHWKLRHRAAAKIEIPYPSLEEVLQPIERRERLIIFDDRTDAVLPSYTALPHENNLGRSLGRLLTWIYLFTTVVLGVSLDWLLRRDSLARRAVHLRRGLERASGTFVKFGQQAAMRIDLLPWAYCVELSKMLDKMVPFPVEHALAAVERTIGKPWQEVFAVFDPEPIGSASIACVYQAVLKDGTKVAVKVRRPEIIQVFLADLQVLDWLSELAEFLTIFRPGLTHNLRAELRETLLEELDFRREARFQDTFRRNAPKSGRNFFTAPRVFFEFSGEEVLVQEFVSGLWLWEVIGAVEQKTPQTQAALREYNIDPVQVARRILWASFWSMDEHIFFHADPHPANILVRENNELTFIDFGSCGSFNSHQRLALEQMAMSMERRDAEGMALSTLTLMEPLPPLDLPAMEKMLQKDFLRVLYTFNTPAEYTEYWERTSARQWVVTVQNARKFNVSLNLHMLRMIRATLLYDSIVLRLDPELSRFGEYEKFMEDRAELIKKRWRARLRENAGDGLFLQMEEMTNSVNDIMLRAQTTLGRPIVAFGATVDKVAFTISVLSRLVGRVLFVTVLAMGGLAASRSLYGSPVTLASFSDALLTVMRSPFYQLFLLAAAVLNLRHIMFRLQESDDGARRRGR
jgi:ubiquinone biosynthesis protein